MAGSRASQLVSHAGVNASSVSLLQPRLMGAVERARQPMALIHAREGLHPQSCPPLPASTNGRGANSGTHTSSNSIRVANSDPKVCYERQRLLNSFSSLFHAKLMFRTSGGKQTTNVVTYSIIIRRFRPLTPGCARLYLAFGGDS